MTQEEMKSTKRTLRMLRALVNELEEISYELGKTLSEMEENMTDLMEKEWFATKKWLLGNEKQE